MFLKVRQKPLFHCPKCSHGRSVSSHLPVHSLIPFGFVELMLYMPKWIKMFAPHQWSMGLHEFAAHQLYLGKVRSATIKLKMVL